MALGALSKLVEQNTLGDPNISLSKYHQYVQEAQLIMGEDDINLVDYLDPTLKHPHNIDALAGILRTYLIQKLQQGQFVYLTQATKLLERLSLDREARYMSDHMFVETLRTNPEKSYYSTPMTELDLPRRAYNSLGRYQITTIGQLLDFIDGNPDNLLLIRNLGVVIQKVIMSTLIESGYYKPDEYKEE